MMLQAILDDQSPQPRFARLDGTELLTRYGRTDVQTDVCNVVSKFLGIVFFRQGIPSEKLKTVVYPSKFDFLGLKLRQTPFQTTPVISFVDTRTFFFSDFFVPEMCLGWIFVKILRSCEFLDTASSFLV